VDLIRRFGADILRLWSALDYRDGSISRRSSPAAPRSPKINTAVPDLEPVRFRSARDPVAFGALVPLDRWALAQARSIASDPVGLRRYEFHSDALVNFSATTLAFYLDILGPPVRVLIRRCRAAVGADGPTGSPGCSRPRWPSSFTAEEFDGPSRKEEPVHVARFETWTSARRFRSGRLPGSG
jgi:hypothetical protein